MGAAARVKQAAQARTTRIESEGETARNFAICGKGECGEAERGTHRSGYRAKTWASQLGGSTSSLENFGEGITEGEKTIEESNERRKEAPEEGRKASAET